MDIFEKLKNLYNDLTAEGCNQFYIYGINKSVPDDVICLHNDGQKWELYYTEKNTEGELCYSKYDLDDAINCDKNYIVKNMFHWHLISFTRSNKIMNKYKKLLENNISAYKNSGDYFIRLFVKNKDIFKSKELFDNIPYYDTCLKI